MKPSPVGIAACLALVFSAAMAWPGSAKESETPEAWAKKRLDALAKEKSCALAVLVSRDGKITFQGAAGMADVENKIEATLETKFRIGSATKQFTAAAVLRLAEEGKLALTDRIGKHFPGFPRGEEVTVEQLLNHTSGIHSFTDKPDFLKKVAKPTTPAALLEWIQKDPPDFAPGAGFHYNNSAYFMAGELVARVSGKPFAAYLHDTFFEPLGMKNTGIFDNANPPPLMAKGYSFAEGKLTPALDWDMSWAGGAGALYSTVGDLFLWNEALFGGKVLKADSFKAQTTPVKLPPDVAGMNYGYGLVMSEMDRLPAVGHGGGLNGWSSDLLRLPEQHCTVVVLANAMPTPPGLEPATLSRGLAKKFLADAIAKLPPPAVDRSVDPKSYTAFAGRYDYNNAVMTMSVEDGRLFAQLTGQPKHEIFPKSPNVFFWKVTDAQVEFLRDEKGAVIAARHTQAGNSFRALRLGEEAVKLTEAELDAVVGKYQYGVGSVLTVTRDGDRVFAQLTGQPAFPIFPKSATEYEWRVVPARVEFEKDKDGKVIRAIHRQNGATVKAAKIQ